MNHPLWKEIETLSHLHKKHPCSVKIDGMYETCLTYAVNSYEEHKKVTPENESVLKAIKPFVPEEDLFLVEQMYKDIEDGE